MTRTMTMTASIARPHPARRHTPGRLVRRRGLTLFGSLMGLGLGAVATIGAVGLYQSATDAMKRTETLGLITQLSTSVRTIHASSGTYGTADLVPLLYERAAIPDAALSGTAAAPTITHPYGYFVEIEGADSGRNFTIELQRLDPSICFAIADAYRGLARARSGLAYIRFDGTPVNASALTADRIRANCTGADNSQNVALAFQ